MTQQNERVFFNDGEYLVTDLRFVRNDGITHPMSTIERVYPGQDEVYVGPERPSGCTAPFYYTLFLVGIASCGTGGLGVGFLGGLLAFSFQDIALWAIPMFFPSSL